MPPSRWVFALGAEGRVRVVECVGQVSRYPEAELVQEALTELAARELACPAGQTTLHDLGGVSGIDQWSARGCGRQSSYLRIDDSGAADRVPGHLGTVVYAETTAIVSMSAERDAAVQEAWGFVRGIGMRDAVEGSSALGASPWWIDRYFSLQAWGARDLQCPRAQVLPLVFSRGAMAEGCGKRATYWGERLSSIVPINP